MQVVNIGNDQGDTPLLVATQNGFTEVVTELLRCECIKVDQVSFHLAVKCMPHTHGVSSTLSHRVFTLHTPMCDDKSTPSVCSGKQ